MTPARNSRRMDTPAPSPGRMAVRSSSGSSGDRSSMGGLDKAGPSPGVPSRAHRVMSGFYMQETEVTNAEIESHRRALGGSNDSGEREKFERLKTIWARSGEKTPGRRHQLGRGEALCREEGRPAAHGGPVGIRRPFAGEGLSPGLGLQSGPRTEATHRAGQHQYATGHRAGHDREVGSHPWVG